MISVSHKIFRGEVFIRFLLFFVRWKKNVILQSVCNEDLPVIFHSYGDPLRILGGV